MATLAALDGDCLYLGGLIQDSPSDTPPYSSAVYAYDAATCTPRWHAPYVASDLIAGGSTVCMVAADSGTVTGVRGDDGKVLWHSNAVTSTLSGMGWRFSTQPALLGTTLFATSGIMGGGIHVFGGYGWVHLYAFGGASGFEYWHVPIGTARASPRTSCIEHATGAIEAFAQLAASHRMDAKRQASRRPDVSERRKRA